MTLAHPASLALLAAWLLVILFAVLRARQRRREVGGLFLWRDLHDSPVGRTRNLRVLLDPLVLTQLACVLAFALALAQPLWTARRPGLESVALVIDGSASMRTASTAGTTRYTDAVGRALALLDDSPARTAAVVQWTRDPVVLAEGGSSSSEARAALRASGPSWRGDGSGSDLARALAAIGGPTRFERIVVFTDHPVDAPPFPVDTVLLSGGENVAITAFAVRPTADGTGVSAFVELHNDTDEYQDGRLTVGDEYRKTSLDVFLEPAETASRIVPFPGARGTRFTAALDIADDFQSDNTRYFSLERSLLLRVRWIGTENRFLKAALESVLPVLRVQNDEPADLTVACDTTLGALPGGNVLLIHTNVVDVVTLDEATPSRGTAAAWTPDHPLLAGVRAEDVFVERMPVVTVSVPSKTLLGVGTTPLLFEIPAPDRSILVLTADLLATNLPITVDFPLLVRTLVSSLVRADGDLTPEWTCVGDPIPLIRSGRTATALDPTGKPIAVAAGQRALVPDEPGVFTLVAGDDRYPVSVNLAPSESRPAVESPAVSREAVRTAPEAKPKSALPLWPALAGVACVLLLAELILARRRALRAGGDA